MSEDELMAQIFVLNERIGDLCFERDELITKLNELRDSKKGAEEP